MGPRLVFLENVRGLLTASGGRVFGNVLGTLADLGYDSEWLCLKASDVGASHRRERVFILAHAANDHGRRGIWETEAGTREDGERWRGPAIGDGELAAFPPGPEDRDAWARVLAERPDLAPALADGDGSRLERRSVCGAGRSDESPPRTVGGAVVDSQRDPGEQFGTPRRMGREAWEPIPRDGNGEGETKSEFRRVADGLSAGVDACRKERLRACGNGVVPLQAAVAFVVLARRAGLMA